MIYLAIGLTLTIITFGVLEHYNSLKLAELRTKVEHLQQAISYESKLYDYESTYETLYDERIQSLKNELGMQHAGTPSESEEAPIYMDGLYNIKEEDNHTVVTNRPIREVVE